MAKSETTDGPMAKIAARKRWIRDDVKKLMRLQRAIRKCQQNSSSATLIPRSPYSLFRLSDSIRALPRCEDNPDAFRRSSFSQLQEAMSTTFGNRRRSYKKPRRNAFVIRPYDDFRIDISALPSSAPDFEASSVTAECNSTFPLRTDPNLSEPDLRPIVTQVISESMKILRTGFSGLHLSDGK
ncbi:hypothetical protein IV203_004131 [Nitzschia inconspicua]|uniref:Uncharacterized protein n=1 Tax=Nitzschia inconspicua TaxID=303405 RepID=A0A9K3PP12_9STRA|nr:hypothetical protein IV203_004131 [Nitzschia inconspicua]